MLTSLLYESPNFSSLVYLDTPLYCDMYPDIVVESVYTSIFSIILLESIIFHW